MSSEALTWAKNRAVGRLAKKPEIGGGDKRPPPVSPAAKKLLLMILADYSDAKGFSFPSIRTLVAQSELGRSTVIRCLAELEEQGLIRKQDRHSHSGRQTSNGYFLQIPHPVEGHTVKPSPTTGRVPERDPRGSQIETVILDSQERTKSAREAPRDLPAPAEQSKDPAPTGEATLADQWDRGPGRKLRKIWESKFDSVMRHVVIAAKQPGAWTVAIKGANRRSIGFWRDQYQADMARAAGCAVEIITLDQMNRARSTSAKAAA